MIRKHKCPIFLSTVVMWWLKCVLVFQLCHMSFGLRGWWNSDSAIMQAFLPFRVHKQLVENKQGIFFVCVCELGVVTCLCPFFSFLFCFKLLSGDWNSYPTNLTALGYLNMAQLFSSLLLFSLHYIVHNLLAIDKEQINLFLFNHTRKELEQTISSRAPILKWCRHQSFV
jgi:hypothetical protein